jgi:hypothetical protein
MASQVPYNPTSTVAPELGQRSYLRVDAPINAFGGNIADATAHLGQVTANAGKELYDRAVAMQTLNEQAKATAATADFMVKLGDRWAQFKSLEGDAAVQDQPKFIADLNRMRAEQRDSLTSPFAQRAFDNETRMQQARTVMSAAEYAGQQNRKFVQDASRARMGTNHVLVQSNPTDNDTYEAAIENNSQEIDINARGKPPETVSLEKQTANSKLTLDRAKALAEAGDEGPVLARKFIEDAAKKGRLVGGDIVEARNFVRSKLDARTAGTEAAATISGENLAVGGRIVSPQQASDAIGGIDNNSRSFSAIEPGKSENNPLLGKYRVAEQNLGQLLRQANMPVMSKDEFLANPSAQEQLFKSTFAQLQTDKGSFNAAYAEWRKMNPGRADSTPTDIIQANRILAKKATRSELDEIVRGRIKEIDDDPMLQERAAQQVALRKTRMEQRERDITVEANQILTGRLNEKGANGKLISSEEELLDTPERKAAWEKLPETVKKGYLKTLESNAQGGYPKTDENQARFIGMRGAMLDPGLTPDQRDELLTTNIAALEMPASQRHQLLTMQAKLLREAIKAPNVENAMKQLRPTLDSLEINAKNRDDLNAFRGALAGVIQDRMEELKRPLNPKEIQEVGKELLRDRAYSRFGGLWNTKDRNFKAPVPEKEIPNITAKFKELNAGREPTDAEITAVWVRMQAAVNYQKLYGKPKIPDRVPQ